MESRNPKSRGNWNIGMCLKMDCVNRNFECENCIKFSAYANKGFYERIKEIDKILDETNQTEEFNG
jgi:hypothetical protein